MYCSRCGGELPAVAYFCPKCGSKTREGVEAGISTLAEDLSDAISRIGGEMEGALSVAGREMEKVLKRVRDKISEATSKEPAICGHCGGENSSNARFCYKCGKRLN